MAYPASLSTFSGTTAQGTSTLSSPDHALDHRTLGSAVGTIEQVIGTTAGTAIAMNFAVGDFAARINSGGTLQQAVSGTINNSDIKGYYTTPQGTTVAAGGTATLNLALSNEWRVTLGAGNATFAVTNAVDGMKFLVEVTQDSVGTRTITWWNTIRWQDSTAPTTSGGTKIDNFGFIATGTATFLGIVVSQGH